tara:strand:+ start:221 stop:523 length:303 start_codon:yes stop_codon:yes gene_type:complete
VVKNLRNVVSINNRGKMRKLRMKKKQTKPIRRKCHNCGKMATNPVQYHLVPSIPYGEPIPTYSKSAPKTKRVDLKGDMKIIAKNYCDRECMAEGRSKLGV